MIEGNMVANGGELVSNIRISCGGLCRIYDPNTHRFLLGMNRNRLKKRQQVLTPIGGVIAYTPSALPIPFTEEKVGSEELRLLIDMEMADDFATWFETRLGREVNPFRELWEELVEEHRVLTKLTPNDVAMVYSHTFQEQRFSDRAGATGLLTHSYQEIYDVQFLRWEHWATLLRATAPTGLHWVSREEIERGMTTHDSIRIEARPLIQ